MQLAPDLVPLNRTVVRAYGAMADLTDYRAMGLFSVAMISRAADYLEILEYAGDPDGDVPRLWYAHEKGYLSNLNLHMEGDVSRLGTLTLREINLEGALHLASLELLEVVPESAQSIKIALWVARDSVREGGRWHLRKNRVRAKGARRHLREVASTTPVHTFGERCRSMVANLFPGHLNRSRAA